MLRRVNAALYEGDAGEKVSLLAVPQGNLGTKQASFEYRNQAVTEQTIQGEIPFERSFRLRCRLLRDIPISSVRRKLSKTLLPLPGR